MVVTIIILLILLLILATVKNNTISFHLTDPNELKFQAANLRSRLAIGQSHMAAK